MPPRAAARLPLNPANPHKRQPAASFADRGRG